MLRKSIAALLVVAALPVFAQNAAPQNLDFESGAPGEVPPGWHSPTLKLGFTAELTAESPKQGKQSVRVSGAPQPMQNGAPSFGNIMQTIDATPFRGRRVTFRGAVRVQGEGAAAALWMRVDRPDKQMGFFDNMQNRLIRASEWTYYEIAGDVAADATRLNIGMMLQQEGTAWLDDVSLVTSDALPVRGAAPRPLTPRGLENVVAFARLFGIVRHFHASDEAAKADWNAIAIDGVDVVESAADARQLASRLQDLFLPIAPSIRIAVTGTQMPALQRPDDARTLVSWTHKGFGQSQELSNIYSSERTRTPGTSAPRELTTNLGGSVTAVIPLDVYANETHTLPRPTREAPKHANAIYTGNDRSTRLGDVILAWNVIAHFYPYFDVTDVDWKAELATALRAAATDKDEVAFYGTLRRMIAAIDDGHGSVAHPAAFRGRASLPLLWRVLGDSLVVTTVDAGVTGVNPGDVVVAINGKPVMPSLREIEAQIPGATPQWKRIHALRELALGPTSAQATLTIRNADGTTRTATLTHAPRAGMLTEKRPAKISELKPGYWYVDLDAITEADFEASLDKLAAAKGIVFDMRGYPRVSPKVLRRLSDVPLASAQWNVPVVRWPDLAHVEWDASGRWTLDPLPPRLPKNIVFLTNGRAISYAETWMGIVEHYKLGTIVGEPTAGTNGNINVIALPGEYRVVFTGMKVLKHDGSRHHGVGIVPTVPVLPTIEGIRAGRDEQLEKALELLVAKE
jgi:C-terminal processing protease CtpA/Prc